MNDILVLDSLKVQGFRAFEDLQIEKLGRVNLITGKNNVGKTCLLEALQVYARRGEPNVLQSLLVRRDETYISGSGKISEATRLLEDVRHVFYGRAGAMETDQKLVIGSLHQEENRVVFSIEMQEAPPKESGATVSVDGKFLVEVEEGKFVSAESALARDLRPLKRFFALRFGGQTRSFPFAPETFFQRNVARLMGEELKHTFIWSRGLDEKVAAAYWDQVALSAEEDDVIKALQIVAPHLMRVNLVSAKEGNPDRVAMVRLSTRAEPIPMRSLGEGMNRLFGLSLALVSSGGGLLLVDEIETGLHYSVQADMWRLVFETAKRLDIQVFATTHSYDCIRAFEEAASGDSETEGVLVRLENKDGKVVCVPFDERRLEIATREGIEVR